VKSNKLWTIVILLLVVSIALFGCSSNSDKGASESQSASGGSPSKEQVTVSMLMYVTAKATQEAYQQIVDKFQQDNPDIRVDLQFQGADYENIMKVKMAANELPDIFDTHGWAQVRYGKYLEDLRDQAWVGNISDTIKPVVTDKDGKVYVLPVSEAKDGFAYNVQVLEKYGIQPPQTLSELESAFEKIKTESGGKVIPLLYAGADNWTIGQFFDYFAVSLLNVPNGGAAGNALLDGSFDWNEWTPLPAKFKEYFDKGYINKDVFTMKFSDYAKLFATDQVAFVSTAPSFADDVYKVNPDSKIGIMPVPAWNDGEQPNFSGGERNTMGVWKDSKVKDAAKKVLAYFSQTDNLKLIENTVKIPSGLKGVEADHEFVSYYKQYESVPVFPYFDRVYLPSGMWDVMCTTGMELLAGGTTPEGYSKTMEENVRRLLQQ